MQRLARPVITKGIVMYQKWRKGYFLLEQDKALALPATARICVMVIDEAILYAMKKGS